MSRPSAGATRDDSDLGASEPRRPAALAQLVRMGHLGELHLDRAELIPLGAHQPGHGTVELARGDADASLPGSRGQPARLEAADEWMSRPHARLTVEPGGAGGGGERWLQDAGSKNGVILLEPAAALPGGGLRPARVQRVERHRLRHGDLFVTGRTVWRYLAERLVEPEELVALSLRPFGPSRSVAPAYLQAVRVMGRAAPSPLSVLLTGPSGAGKEVAARELHARSGRQGKLVAVNCAALPEGMVEGQLFGHKKGAFTGATDSSPGLILSAHGGTLLLDEIGDMPLLAQAKLLRVLEDREVLAVGETTPRRVDVRVVAATHADLGARVQEGRFRGDLLARLAQVTVRLPSLDERREDLGTLLPVLLGRAGVRLSALAARALLLHAWPYQIRELASGLAAAALMAGGSGGAGGAGEPAVLLPEHLPEAIRQVLAPPSPASPAPAPAPAPANAPVPGNASAEPGVRPSKGQLEQLLRRHAGNVTAAASELGKGKMQIYRWLRHYGLHPDQYR
jgi:DNA-binding NtrC family response regulator